MIIHTTLNTCTHTLYHIFAPSTSHYVMKGSYSSFLFDSLSILYVSAP